MSIGSRIKQRREELGLTQPELAKLMNVSKGTIGNYETGISYPNEKNFFKLFEILKCDANYLYQDDIKKMEQDFFSDKEKRLVKKYRTLDEYGKEAVDNLLATEYKRCEAEKKPPIIMFRKLSANKASAGCGYDLNNVDEWREIEVVDTPEARQADFAVEIDGASMEPTYYDGDILYIQLAKEIPVGKIGLFMKGGKGYVKEYGKDRLISHNDDYDDIYPDDEIIECIGRVIGVAELP